MSEKIWTTINGHLLGCALIRSWDDDGPDEQCDCGTVDDFWDGPDWDSADRAEVPDGD